MSLVPTKISKNAKNHKKILLKSEKFPKSVELKDVCFSWRILSTLKIAGSQVLSPYANITDAYTVDINKM